MWWPLIERDIGGVVRSRRVKNGIALVAILFAIGGYVLPFQTQSPTVSQYAGLMAGATPLVLSLFGILLGYRSVVGERAGGQLTLVLSMPYSRLNVLFGKFLARGGLLAGTVTVGILVAAWFVAYPFGTVDVGTLVVYLVVTVLYGLAFLAMGVALSTLTTSTRIATTAAFGVFLLFALLWGRLAPVFALALDSVGVDVSTGLPEWALFVYGIAPTELYARTVNGLVRGIERGPYLDPNAAWYLGSRTALALLCAWVLVPLGAGYLRFRGTDL